MIWFGSSFLISPLFPKLVSLRSKGKDTSKLFFKVILYTTTLVVLGCLIFYVAPTFIVTLLYGEAYLDSIPLILLFGISLGIYSIIQIFMTYNLAIEKYSFVYVFTIGIIFEILGIFLFHSTLMDIIKIVLITNVFILISFLIINKDDLLNNFK
jgi:O-antigen/teichoic acid export membrane protein